MAEASVFTKILAGEIPGEILHETERVFVIRPLEAQALVHLLVIPKTADYRTVVELAAADPALLAEIVAVANEMAAAHPVPGGTETGEPGDFRLIFNNGEGAGQTVFHVHAHVLAGGLTEGSLGDG